MKRFKAFDIIIFAAVVIIAVSSAVLLFKGTGKTAKIYVDNELVKTVSLQKDIELDLNLEMNNIIVVNGGKIAVVSADCPDKTCVMTGYIDTSGQSIVCIPSKLVIKVE